MKVCRCWYYFKSTFNFSSLVAQKESAACSHCCFLKEQCFSPPLTMYVFVWSGDTDVFSLGGRLFPNVLRVQVLPVDVLQSWGTSVRSQIIQAAQACPRLKDDVLGDSCFFCFFKKNEKSRTQRHGGSPDTGSYCLTGRTRNMSLQSVESGIYLAYLVMTALQYELGKCGWWFPEGLTVGELGVSGVSRRCLMLCFIMQLESGIGV